jgi:hypothetical protein
MTRRRRCFLTSCSHIVVIGHVKWIEGSKHTGKDNYASFRFDAMHASGPVFHWRDRGEMRSTRYVKICEHLRRDLRAGAIECAVLQAGMQA